MPREVSAVIERVAALGAGVFEIGLKLGESPPSFLPGQYLHVIDPSGARIAFSIASPPQALPDLVLHYRPTPGSDDAQRIDRLLKTSKTLSLELPHGDCGVSLPLTRPLILIAGGTGVSQARSIALALAEDATAPIHLYWGGGTAAALYAREEFDDLATRAEHFNWTGAVEAPTHGLRTGTAAQVVTEDVAAGRLDLDQSDVLLCGGPPMVWGTVSALRAIGLAEARTRSDVFSYAPRDDLWTD